MNLRKLKVEELSIQEVKNVNAGGIFGRLLGYLAGMIYNGGDSPDSNPYAPHRKL